MNMMSEKQIDASLRQLFKEELPRERKDEWFVKKTLNRLPEKRRPTFSRPEIISYVLSVLMLISGWVWLWIRFHQESVLTYGTLMISGALIVVSFGVLGSIMYPIVKRG